MNNDDELYDSLDRQGSGSEFDAENWYLVTPEL